MDQPQPAVGINLSQRDQHHFNFSGEDPRESDLRRIRSAGGRFRSDVRGLGPVGGLLEQSPVGGASLTGAELNGAMKANPSRAAAPGTYSQPLEAQKFAGHPCRARHSGEGLSPAVRGQKGPEWAELPVCRASASSRCVT